MISANECHEGARVVFRDRPNAPVQAGVIWEVTGGYFRYIVIPDGYSRERYLLALDNIVAILPGGYPDKKTMLVCLQEERDRLNVEYGAK